MKKILPALVIFAMTGACLLALNENGHQSRLQNQSNQDDWLAQSQQLAELQTEQATLTEKVRELHHTLRNSSAPLALELVNLLLTNDLKSVPPQMQDKLLSEFGRGGNSSGSYVLVSKAALLQTALSPVKAFPKNAKLTDDVCGILAITPEERRMVEGALAENLEALGAWARVNVQREGPKDALLAQYTIPANPETAQALTDRLFSTIDAAIGEERTGLLRRYHDYARIRFDGNLAAKTNILSIHRISAPPGLGYRAGWKWENSETINTYPEPIKLGRFPYAFYGVFPGGWTEVLQREGLAVPDESLQKP